MSYKDMAELSTTKEKGGNIHTQVSEVVKDNKYLENGTSMLLKQKTKQRKRLHTTRIYLDKCSTYNHMYNEELLTDLREGNRWPFGHFNAGTTCTNRKGCFWFYCVLDQKGRYS